jgi:hypothetical protein
MASEFQAAFDFWPLDIRRRARFGDTSASAEHAARAERVQLSGDIDRQAASLGARIAATRMQSPKDVPDILFSQRGAWRRLGALIDQEADAGAGPTLPGPTPPGPTLAAPPSGWRRLHPRPLPARYQSGTGENQPRTGLRDQPQPARGNRRTVDDPAAGPDR